MARNREDALCFRSGMDVPHVDETSTAPWGLSIMYTVEYGFNSKAHDTPVSLLDCFRLALHLKETR